MRRNRFQSLMKRDVRTLTRLDIQKAVNYEAGKVAPKTVINAWGLLRPVLKDYGMVFEGIKLPQKIKKKKTYLSMDEITRLIDAAVGDGCRNPGIVMAVWLGLRRSEIMGLCWDCVDLERGTIEIRRAMVPDKENKWVIKEGAKRRELSKNTGIPGLYHGQAGKRSITDRREEYSRDRRRRCGSMSTRCASWPGYRILQFTACGMQTRLSWWL